ncbi:MAG: hypothetical protein JW993_15415 [Sedimentisphaerales bacterium]|nr:hypothetical protein [Sedimentisphaerales bacterium]
MHTQRSTKLLAIALSSTALLLSNAELVNSNNQSDTGILSQEIQAKRASRTVDGLDFCLTVVPGDEQHKTVAVVTIANLGEDPISFPTPLVMPLSGQIGYKNTIEIRNRDSRTLEMTGLHGDYVQRPVTRLLQSSRLTRNSQSWCFELENTFPELRRAGQYTIDFCLISEPSEHNKATWKGTVRLAVSIDKDGPYRLQPQPLR